MFLKTIHLENFRQVKNLDLEFDRINIFVAGNAHGKSSIFKAIQLLRTNSTEQPLEHYVRWGQEAPLVVHGVDSYNSKEIDYRIERSKAKQTADRLLVYDNNKYLNSDATGQIEKILDPVFAHYSAIAPQHESINILFEKASVRLEKLKKIFGLDFINDKVSQLDIEIGEHKVKIDSLKNEIKVLEGIQYEYQDVPVLPDITDSQKEFDLLSIEKLEYEQSKKEYDSYIQKQSEYAKAQNEIKQLEKELEIKQLELEQYNNVLSNISEKDYYDLKSEIDAARLKQKEYSSYLDLVNKRERLKSELDLILIKRVRQINISQADIDKSIEQKHNLEFEIKSIKKSIDLAREGKCPTCGQDYCIDINEYEISQKDKESILINLNTDIEKQKKLLKDNDTLISENLIATEKRKGIQNSIDDLDKQIKLQTIIDDPGITEKWLQDKDLELNEIQIKIKKQKENQNSKEKLQNEIIQKQTQVTEKQKISKPAPVIKPVEFDYEKFNQLQKDINIHEQRIIEYNRIIQFNLDIDEKRKNKYLSITEKQKEIDTCEHNKKVAEDAKKFLSKEFSAYILKEKLEILEKAMNKFFASSLEPKYNIKVKSTAKDVEFEFTLDGNFYAPVLSFSGFERDLLAMSFRVGLLSLQDIGFMMVDEIDSMADSTNSIQLFDILVQQDFIEQFFIITHKKETYEFLESEHNAKIFYIDELLKA